MSGRNNENENWFWEVLILYLQKLGLLGTQNDSLSWFGLSRNHPTFLF